MGKYDDLRSEVRAFCSDDASGLLKDAAQQEAFRKLTERLDEIIQEHP